MAPPIAREGDDDEQRSAADELAPIRPPAGLRLPPADQQAPVWDVPLASGRPHPAFWLLGAHGGACVSSLARTWAPAADARQGWPAQDRYRGVVVVARTHREGLDAAHSLLLQAAGGRIGGCALLGLVTVPDQPGSLPATLRRRRDVVESAAPQYWRVPYLPDYRTLTYDQMPVWSPKDAPVTTTRLQRATTRWNRDGALAYPDPDLVVIGSAIFDAARQAMAR